MMLDFLLPAGLGGEAPPPDDAAEEDASPAVGGKGGGGAAVAAGVVIDRSRRPTQQGNAGDVGAGEHSPSAPGRWGAIAATAKRARPVPQVANACVQGVPAPTCGDAGGTLRGLGGAAAQQRGEGQRVGQHCCICFFFCCC